MYVYVCICWNMNVCVCIHRFIYIYIYTYIYWHGLGGNSESLPLAVMRARGASSSSYPYSCKCNWRGVWAEENGTMHWHALPVTSESVLRVAGRSRPTRTPSQAGRRLDSESEVAWTSLPVSIRLNSSGQSRSNLTESSSRSWPATIEAVQPEGRGSSHWVDSWAAAVRQSVWGPGRNSAGSRHSVRSHLARVSVDTADLVSSGPGGSEVANNNFLKRHKTSHSFLRMSFLARSATAPFRIINFDTTLHKYDWHALCQAKT